MGKPAIRYISDENGKFTDVIVSIELWHKIGSEKETAYLIKSKTMKKRLLEARSRKKGVTFEEVREKLGV